MIPAEILVRNIPLEPGCLFGLVYVETGAPFHAVGEVPADLLGTKWPDVSTWCVLYWAVGRCYAAELKSEDGLPWPFKSVMAHFEKHRDHWRQVAINKEAHQ